MVTRQETVIAIAMSQETAFVTAIARATHPTIDCNLLTGAPLPRHSQMTCHNMCAWKKTLKKSPTTQNFALKDFLQKTSSDFSTLFDVEISCQWRTLESLVENPQAVQKIVKCHDHMQKCLPQVLGLETHLFQVSRQSHA